MRKDYLQPSIRVKLVVLEKSLLIASGDVYDTEIDYYAKKEKNLRWDESVNS